MKLVDTAVARPVTMWMFTLGIMLFGLVAMGATGRQFTARFVLPHFNHPH